MTTIYKDKQGKVLRTDTGTTPARKARPVTPAAPVDKAAGKATPTDAGKASSSQEK
ncbi:MAG: hypothetical protein AB1832_01200 [Pseudomonadota bacterium]